jgi:ketosteroid isomerase-like protein
MSSASEDATQVFYAFYAALDDLLQAKGLEKMEEIWHHAEQAATVHPFGGWARGWDEVWATWQEGAAVFACYQGHAARSEPIGAIHDVKVTVIGTVAICTSIYQSKLYMSDGPLEMKVNCTDMAELVNGRWKIIHHHADQAPSDVQARIGRMVQAGHS